MENDMTRAEVPAEASREAEIEEVARRVYDELRHFVVVPPSMTSRIYRYGFLPKKTVDGSGNTRMHGSRNYHKEWVTRFVVALR